MSKETALDDAAAELAFKQSQTLMEELITVLSKHAALNVQVDPDKLVTLGKPGRPWPTAAQVVRRVADDYARDLTEEIRRELESSLVSMAVAAREKAQKARAK